MKNENKYNKSRIFKAAWTMVKKYSMSISAGLKKAWKFAKEDVSKAVANLICGHAAKLWNADSFSRLYFADQSYLQITTKERKPYGYYENHRHCKGERFTTTYVKAVGAIASSIADEFISTREFIASKF